MIVEDSGEQQIHTTGKKRGVPRELTVSKFFISRGIKFKREAIVYNGIRMGDYTNDKFEYMVEVKRGKDLSVSLFDGSLFDQLRRMCKYYRGPKFLLFEGDWDQLLEDTLREYGKYEYTQLISLKYKLIEFNVGWLHTWSIQETTDEIIRLDNYIELNENFMDKYVMKKHISTKDERVRILAQFPGWSKKNIPFFIKKYNNLWDILLLSKDPKTSHKENKGHGIGIITLNKMKDILESNKVVDINEQQSRKKSYRRNGSKTCPRKDKESSCVYPYRKR